MIVYVLELIEPRESFVLGAFSTREAAWECIDEGHRKFPYFVTGIEVDALPSRSVMTCEPVDYPEVRWADPISPRANVADCGIDGAIA